MRNHDMFTVIRRELAWLYLYNVIQPMMHCNKPKFYYNLYKKEGCSRAINIWCRQWTVILEIVYSWKTTNKSEFSIERYT